MDRSARKIGCGCCAHCQCTGLCVDRERESTNGLLSATGHQSSPSPPVPASAPPNVRRVPTVKYSHDDVPLSPTVPAGPADGSKSLLCVIENLPHPNDTIAGRKSALRSRPPSPDALTPLISGQHGRSTFASLQRNATLHHHQQQLQTSISHDSINHKPFTTQPQKRLPGHQTSPVSIEVSHMASHDQESHERQARSRNPSRKVSPTKDTRSGTLFSSQRSPEHKDKTSSLVDTPKPRNLSRKTTVRPEDEDQDDDEGYNANSSSARKGSSRIQIDSFSASEAASYKLAKSSTLRVQTQSEEKIGELEPHTFSSTPVLGTFSEPKTRKTHIDSNDSDNNSSATGKRKKDRERKEGKHDSDRDREHEKEIRKTLKKLKGKSSRKHVSSSRTRRYSSESDDKSDSDLSLSSDDSEYERKRDRKHNRLRERVRRERERLHEKEEHRHHREKEEQRKLEKEERRLREKEEQRQREKEERRSEREEFKAKLRRKESRRDALRGRQESDREELHRTKSTNSTIDSSPPEYVSRAPTPLPPDAHQATYGSSGRADAEAKSISLGGFTLTRARSRQSKPPKDESGNVSIHPRKDGSDHVGGFGGGPEAESKRERLMNYIDSVVSSAVNKDKDLVPDDKYERLHGVPRPDKGYMTPVSLAINKDTVPDDKYARKHGISKQDKGHVPPVKLVPSKQSSPTKTTMTLKQPSPPVYKAPSRQTSGQSNVPAPMLHTMQAVNKLVIRQSQVQPNTLNFIDMSRIDEDGGPYVTFRLEPGVHGPFDGGETMKRKMTTGHGWILDAYHHGVKVHGETRLSIGRKGPVLFEIGVKRRHVDKFVLDGAKDVFGGQLASFCDQLHWGEHDDYRHLYCHSPKGKTMKWFVQEPGKIMRLFGRGEDDYGHVYVEVRTTGGGGGGGAVAAGLPDKNKKRRAALPGSSSKECTLIFFPPVQSSSKREESLDSDDALIEMGFACASWWCARQTYDEGQVAAAHAEIEMIENIEKAFEVDLLAGA